MFLSKYMKLRETLGVFQVTEDMLKWIHDIDNPGRYKKAFVFKDPWQVEIKCTGYFIAAAMAPTGIGRMEWPFGIYEGEIDDGKMHGYGRLIAQCYYYIGNWKNN